MSWALWVTGPPGSGKTTVTRAAVELLRARGRSVRTFELDAIRRYLVPRPEYTETERELVYRALVYIAAQLVKAHVPVIVDATANRRRWRELARAAIRRFGVSPAGMPPRGLPAARGHARQGTLRRDSTRTPARPEPQCLASMCPTRWRLRPSF
jgi:adenylylsulfate kinase